MGEDLLLLQIDVHRDAQLTKIVRALAAPGSLASRLYGGQQEGDQDAGDRDYHQKFNQGKTAETQAKPGDTPDRGSSPRQVIHKITASHVSLSFITAL